MRIKIASWNIAGCHKISSLNNFDYQPEDLEYFVSNLQSISPDVICLQESHTSLDGLSSNAVDIANRVGMKVVVNSVNSPSHIDENYQLSNAILSAFPAIETMAQNYPDPEGALYFSDGKKAVTHTKNLQFVRFEKFNIANTQMLPVTLFGFSYDDQDRGLKLATGINEVMKKTVATPVLWGGDFNYFDPLKVYPYMQEIGLIDSLPSVSTRPSKDGSMKRPDHIYYSSEYVLIRSTVIPTDTDHYLCVSEFEISA